MWGQCTSLVSELYCLQPPSDGSQLNASPELPTVQRKYAFLWHKDEELSKRNNAIKKLPNQERAGLCEEAYLRGVDDGGTQKASIDTAVWYCEWASSHLVDWYRSIICLLSQGVYFLLYVSKIHLLCISDNWNNKTLTPKRKEKWWRINLTLLRSPFVRVTL